MANKISWGDFKEGIQSINNKRKENKSRTEEKAPETRLDPGKNIISPPIEVAQADIVPSLVVSTSLPEPPSLDYLLDPGCKNPHYVIKQHCARANAAAINRSGVNIDAIKYYKFIDEYFAALDTPKANRTQKQQILIDAFNHPSNKNSDHLIQAFTYYATIRNMKDQPALANRALNEAEKNGVLSISYLKAQYYYERGEVAFKQKQYGKAWTAYEKSLDKCRTSSVSYDKNTRPAMIYLKFGTIKTIQNNWNDAIKWYKKALNSGLPSQFVPHANYGIGEAYYILGFMQKKDKSARNAQLKNAMAYLNKPAPSDKQNRRNFMRANILATLAETDIDMLKQAQGYINSVNINSLPSYDRPVAYLIRADIFARIEVKEKRRPQRNFSSTLGDIQQARDLSDNIPKKERTEFIARCDLLEGKIIAMTAGADEGKIQEALVLIYKALGVKDDFLNNNEKAMDYILKRYEGKNPLLSPLNFGDIELKEALFTLVDLLARVELAKPERTDRDFTTATKFIDYLLQSPDIEEDKHAKLLVLQAKILASEETPEALDKAYRLISEALAFVPYLEKIKNTEELADLYYTAGDIITRRQLELDVSERDFAEAIGYLEKVLNLNPEEDPMQNSTPVLKLRAKKWLTTIKFVESDGNKEILTECIKEADSLILQARKLKNIGLLTTDLELVTLELDLRLTQVDAHTQMKQYFEAEAKCSLAENLLEKYVGTNKPTLVGRTRYYKGKISLYRDKDVSYLLEHAEEIQHVRNLRGYYYGDLVYGYLITKEYEKGIGLLSTLLGKDYTIPEAAKNDPKLNSILTFINGHRDEIKEDLSELQKLKLTFELASFFFYSKQYKNSEKECDLVIKGLEDMEKTKPLKYQQKLVLAKAYFLKGQIILWTRSKEVKAMEYYKKALETADSLLAPGVIKSTDEDAKEEVVFLKARIFFELAEVTRYGELTRDYGASINYYNQAIEILDKVDEIEAKLFKARAFYGLGEIHRYSSKIKDHNKSLSYYEQAINTIAKYADPKDPSYSQFVITGAKVYVGMGNAYKSILPKSDEEMKSNYKNASANFEKALEVASSIPAEEAAKIRDEIAEVEVEANKGLGELKTYSWEGRNTREAKIDYKNAFAAAHTAETPDERSRLLDSAMDSARPHLAPISPYAEVGFSTSDGKYTDPDTDVSSDQKSTNLSVNTRINLGERFDLNIGYVNKDLDFDVENFDVGNQNIFNVGLVTSGNLGALGDSRWTWWGGAGFEYSTIDYNFNGESNKLIGSGINLSGHLDTPRFETSSKTMMISPYLNAYASIYSSDIADAFNPDENGTTMTSYYVEPGARITYSQSFLGGYPSLDLSVRGGADPKNDTSFSLWPMSSEVNEFDLFANARLSNMFHLSGGTRMDASLNFGVNMLSPEWNWGAQTTFYNNRLWDGLGLDPYLTIGYAQGQSDVFESSSFYGSLGIRY